MAYERGDQDAAIRGCMKPAIFIGKESLIIVCPMNDHLVFKRIVEKVYVSVGLARDIANRKIIASCEEIGIGSTDGEAVGIGTDVFENSV